MFTDQSEGVSIVAHASVPWTVKHFDDNLTDVEEMMTSQVHEHIPHLPTQPHSTKLLRWRYSQVQQSYTGAPGCIVVNESPLIVCAGDGFAHSNFDGCACSALAVLDAVKCRIPPPRHL